MRTTHGRLLSVLDARGFGLRPRGPPRNFVCITICKDKHLPTISTRNDRAHVQRDGRDGMFDSVPKDS